MSTHYYITALLFLQSKMISTPFYDILSCLTSAVPPFVVDQVEETQFNQNIGKRQG